MLPSLNKVDSVPRNSAVHHDRPQLPPLFDILSPPSQPKSSHDSGSPTYNRASSSYLVSAGHIPNSYEPPEPSSVDIRPPCISNNQISSPQLQSADVPIAPFHTPGPPRYTGGFLTVLNPESSPVPRLRPASWGSPSKVDEASGSYRLNRSSSSADLQEDSGGEEEDLPFSGRTLPPLPVPHDPWSSRVHMSPDTNSISPRDGFPNSGDLPVINSVPFTPFPTHYSDGEDRSALGQPEPSTSARRLPAVVQPITNSESHPTDNESHPRHGRSKTPRPIPTPRVARRTVIQGPRQFRDSLPEPGDVNVIECGWAGCKAPIQHDTRSVKDHVRFCHGGLFRAKELLTCQWVRKDTGEECGSRLLPESLCRHTLDVHTNLIMKDCVCGKRFRRDTLGRHRCEAQGNL